MRGNYGNRRDLIAEEKGCSVTVEYIFWFIKLERDESAEEE